MSRVSRRDFLKGVALAATATALGCSDQPATKIIPSIIQPEDIVPGEATWYATTCRECPAGCGMLAKTRDGHVIKVEGNPLHPVNGGEWWGKLCPRGQASVQGLYNPDRFPGPMRKRAQGGLAPVSWEEGEKIFLERLLPLAQKGRGERIAFISGLISGTQKELLDHWMESLGAGTLLLYEAYAYEALRKANEIVFGRDAIPTYHVERSDFLISFGANFLETWLSNIQYTRQFAAFHGAKGEKKNFFVFVGPRLSLTAANADQWISVSPGKEYLVALGLLRAILEENPPSLAGERKPLLYSRVKDFPLSALESHTGVKEETFRVLARKFTRAGNPLVVAEGLYYSDPRALETAVAANLLCTLSPGTEQTIDFADPSSLGSVVRSEKMKELTEKIAHQEVDLLIIDRANPIFHLPQAWGFAKAMKNVSLVVSFSSFPNETTALADLILPSHTFLESWGDFSPRQNVRGLIQPAMGPVFDTRDLGDILIATGREIAGKEEFPWRDFHHALQESWVRRERGGKPGGTPESFWLESLQHGGVWKTPASKGLLPEGKGTFSFSFPPAPGVQEKGFDFITYPTIQFFDGWSSNRSFLQEMPDPLTLITWGGWIEINPETAKRMGIEKGDLLAVTSQHGTLEAPAYPYPGIPIRTLAMPIGHGHWAYGRYAQSQSENPARVISPELDPETGAVRWSLPGVNIEKRGRSIPLANTDGSPYQHGREIVQAVSWEEYLKTKDRPSSIDLPLPAGFSQRKDFYPPHEHIDYRWAMAVDLDRCIGCGACVVACYAENNVAVVGKTQVLRGREMSWLHIERYFEPEGLLQSGEGKIQPQARFLPMLCQHCDEAPCESVCPVFAPQHSREGINNQVYNRCIGTRFCNQNCPWKIRRFNWYTYTRPAPLQWQLNPDVTVRQKGVMEKCSFCIQRINLARIRARSEGRKIRDQEFTTACAQTCPADVLTFGSLLDPESRVSRMIKDPRAYQVLGHLNTKPAVIYLKKITQELQDREY